MDIEDLEPQKKKAAPRDLDAMGVEQLENYLAEIEAEVERVRAKITEKKDYLTGARAFFKS